MTLGQWVGQGMIALLIGGLTYGIGLVVKAWLFDRHA
jgi:hypothetical protein